jgi:hypothetical protein
VVFCTFYKYDHDISIPINLKLFYYKASYLPFILESYINDSNLLRNNGASVSVIIALMIIDVYYSVSNSSSAWLGKIKEEELYLL